MQLCMLTTNLLAQVHILKSKSTVIHQIHPSNKRSIPMHLVCLLVIAYLHSLPLLQVPKNLQSFLQVLVTRALTWESSYIIANRFEKQNFIRPTKINGCLHNMLS